MADCFGRNLDRLGHPWKPGRHREHASTDLGNVSRVLPSVHPSLRLGDGLECHTLEFAAAAGGEAGHRLLLDGAKALAMTALDVLEDPSVLPRVREAFAAP